MALVVAASGELLSEAALARQVDGGAVLTQHRLRTDDKDLHLRRGGHGIDRAGYL